MLRQCLILAMQGGQVGHRYILGGESIPLKKVLQLMGSDQRPPQFAHSGSRPPSPKVAAAVLELIANHVTRRPPLRDRPRVCSYSGLRGAGVSRSKKRNHELGYAPRPIEPVLRGDHCLPSRCRRHRVRIRRGAGALHRPTLFPRLDGMAFKVIAQYCPRHAA